MLFQSLQAWSSLQKGPLTPSWTPDLVGEIVGTVLTAGFGVPIVYNAYV
jgi:hypothetical protein